MLAPEQVASGIPHWLRALLVGCLVVLVTGAGLFAYRHFTAPKTMTIAAGSSDGEAVRLISAVAGQLIKTGARVRLKIVETGSELEASQASRLSAPTWGIYRSRAPSSSSATVS
jgi:hypothetical protein